MNREKFREDPYPGVALLEDGFVFFLPFFPLAGKGLAVAYAGQRMAFY